MKALILLFSTFLFWAGSKPAAHRPGKDYALFFAVKDYKNSQVEDLKNPVRDAVALAAVLHDKYGFDTAVVRNPTRIELRNKLDAYRRNFAANASGKFDPGGQLLIFFLGHGESYLDNGYFLPADADPADLPATAIDYNWCRNFIDGFNCKHVLVGVNACYSGMFDPEWKNNMSGGPAGDALPDEPGKGEKLIEDLEAWHSRRILASCNGVTKTPDDDNIFIRRLLEALQKGGGDDRMLNIDELWGNVSGGISPSPRKGFWGKNSGNGTFIFFEKPKPIPSIPTPGAPDDEAFQKDINAYADAKKCGTIDCYKWYLDNFPYGDFRIEADAAIKLEEEKKRRRREDLDWEAAQLKDTPAAYQKYLDAYLGGRYRNQAAQKISELQQAAKDDGSVSPSELVPSTREVESVAPYPAGFGYLANDMVFVQGGEFDMGDLFGEGSSDEKIHTVTVSSFYLSRYEVTVRQFAQFINDTGYKTDAETGGDSWIWDGSESSKKAGVTWQCDVAGNRRPESDWNHPVIHVSWNDAVKYCEWLSKKTGKKFRLPTESEWEFAARERGKKVRFGNGKDSADPKEINFDARESYKKSYSVAGTWRQKTTPVGSLPPANSLGLFDMSGNVWEWCSDWYGDYPAAAQTNPAGATSGSYRVLRGGSWGNYPQNVRAAHRYDVTPSYRFNSVGFRLSRT